MRREIGLIVPQRGLFFGGFDAASELVELARYADANPCYSAVWVGDSLLATPRPESVALLGAMAGVTSRVTLGVGCMGSLPVRDPILFASQWATLDQISAGRMVLVACIAIVKAERASELEGHIYGVTDASRAARMAECVDVLRKLWANTSVSHDGKYLQFTDVSVWPRTVQKPPPVYLASQVAPGPAAERTLRRVARIGDGWMTSKKTDDFLIGNVAALARHLADEGRRIEEFPIVEYHNVNLAADRDEAYCETKRFLDEYYGPIFTEPQVPPWTAAGGVDAAIAHLRRLFDEGATHVAIRLTTWDWRRQLRLLSDEVLPAVLAD
jgi:alkanesulfonate monooxygenase SsuD/methylene tetrahydromethanopterin reductase-like flavin-dependent oxidoreductase (luciferase family)